MTSQAPFAVTFAGFLLAVGPCDRPFAAPPEAPAGEPSAQGDATPRPEHTLPIGNLGSVTCNARRYAFNPTWTLLAAPQDNGSVRLYDVASGAARPPLAGGWKVGPFTYTYSADPPPAYFGFSSDGEQLVWSWGKKLVIWDVASGQVRIRREVPGSSWGFDLSFMALELREKVATAWPVPPSTGAGDRTGSAGGRVTSPDGRTLAYTWGKGFGLFDLASERPIGPMIAVKDLGAMEFSPDSQRLATVGWVPVKGKKRDFAVQIWNVEAMRSAAAR